MADKGKDPTTQDERVRRVIVVVRLPYLPLRDLGELELGQLERHPSSDMRRLWSQRLAVDDVDVFDVGRQSGFNCEDSRKSAIASDIVRRVTYSDPAGYCKSNYSLGPETSRDRPNSTTTSDLSPAGSGIPSGRSTWEEVSHRRLAVQRPSGIARDLEPS